MARTNASDRPSGATEAARGPLIVTEDESLLDDLLRLCAAAARNRKSSSPRPRAR